MALHVGSGRGRGHADRTPGSGLPVETVPLPAAPDGYAYVTDQSGNYIVDASGAYVIAQV